MKGVLVVRDNDGRKVHLIQTRRKQKKASAIFSQFLNIS